MFTHQVVLGIFCQVTLSAENSQDQNCASMHVVGADPLCAALNMQKHMRWGCSLKVSCLSTV